jgi:hypothetical protein
VARDSSRPRQGSPDRKSQPDRVVDRRRDRGLRAKALRLRPRSIPRHPRRCGPGPHRRGLRGAQEPLGRRIDSADQRGESDPGHRQPRRPGLLLCAGLQTRQRLERPAHSRIGHPQLHCRGDPARGPTPSHQSAVGRGATGRVGRGKPPVCQQGRRRVPRVRRRGGHPLWLRASRAARATSLTRHTGRTRRRRRRWRR